MGEGAALAAVKAAARTRMTLILSMLARKSAKLALGYGVRVLDGSRLLDLVSVLGKSDGRGLIRSWAEEMRFI